jgi:hypothetical protein
MSIVGERKFGNSTAQDRQIIEVFGENGQRFDQDGSANRTKVKAGNQISP